MAVIALDTYEVVKELKAAGFEEVQAEALSRILKLARDIDLSHVATKTDLLELRADMRADLQELRSDTKLDLRALEVKIEASRTEIIKRMFGTVGFQTLVVVGALLALVRVILHP